MSSDRMRRVDEAIRQVIGEAVAGELKDPRVGFITVTDVRTSADLSHARVYVSVLGDDAQRQESMEGLRSAHGYLQRRVGSELSLKRTPTLEFAYDDTVDRALRVDALLEGGAAGQGTASRGPLSSESGGAPHSGGQAAGQGSASRATRPSHSDEVERP